MTIAAEVAGTTRPSSDDVHSLGRWVAERVRPGMLIEDDDGRLRPIENIEMYSWLHRNDGAE